MDIKSLVDPEAGLFDRRIFADHKIYESEREKIFGIEIGVMSRLFGAFSPQPAALPTSP
jgi:hypothetical protein